MADFAQRANKLAVPTSATFSFTSPFPTKQATLKQRRTSLASASSPRLVPAWDFRDDTILEPHVAAVEDTTLSPDKNGKMRGIASDEQKSTELANPPIEKRQRKKWTEDETKMLVDGCNIWGVGNWKAILNDPKLVFDNRSPVDLKDRFRTFFPDAYKLHYPNAKTHLSTKVRSTLPDGSSLFEKTRSKKRRPFTPEEDQALKTGYEKYGTVWSTIVKDPIFQEQKRRSTDLRDRFRNAFPDLYQAAGYKPRTAGKKKQPDVHSRVRGTADDQYLSHRAHNQLRRRRTSTNPGFSRSVPQSVAGSEDEESSDEEDNAVDISMPPPARPKEVALQPDAMSTSSIMAVVDAELHIMDHTFNSSFLGEGVSHTSQSMTDLPDSSQYQLWSPPGHQSPTLHLDGWSSAATTSPTSSHFSTDYFATDNSFSERSETRSIGNSAWGPSDWLSGNPRLEPSATSSSNSSFIGGLSPTPSSPFSLNLSHGIIDRYDLFRTSFVNDFASELGPGDSHSTFSDPDLFPSQSFRGFTHHSDYAGDLIFGARTHQPQGQMHYSVPATTFNGIGLGLTGVSQPPISVNPMQLHTPLLPGIDELEITSIHLDDRQEEDQPMNNHVEVGVQKDESESIHFSSDLSALINLPPQTLEEIVGLSTDTSTELEQDMATTPPATPVTKMRTARNLNHLQSYSNMHNRSSSVPPFEHRPVPRSTLPQSDSNLQTLRLPSLYETNVNNTWITSHSGQSVLPMGDLSRQGGDLYDLPFLDLHYFNNLGSTPSPMQHDGLQPSQDEGRHERALDLAHTSFSHHQTGYSASFLSNLYSHGEGYLSADTQSHHHHPSVISPKDLLLQNTNNN